MPVSPRAPAAHLVRARRDLAEHFRQQGAAVAEAWPEVPAKAVAEVFDLARWNRALTPLLLGIATGVSTAVGAIMFGAFRVDTEYDVARTQAWLLTHAAAVAAAINGRTREAVKDALAAKLTADDVRDLFATMADARAPQIAQTEVTAATGFGVREAAQQSGLELTKMWKTGRNPRKSHARMDGQSRPMAELFSNGARWPGDSRLDDKERSGCNCAMTVDARA